MAEVGGEDPNSFDGVPAFVVQRLDEAAKEYSTQFDAFMAMLHEEKESRMTDISRFLALRLDFNGYHAAVKSQGKSGVVTGTPPSLAVSHASHTAHTAHSQRMDYQAEAASGRNKLSFI